MYQCPPPVAFADLMKMELSDKLRCGIEELLELKKITDEKAESAPVPVIQEFIYEELERQKSVVEQMADDRKMGWEELERGFLDALEW